MQKKVFIFLVIGICFIFIPIKAISQEKKILSNLGLYYSPVFQFQYNEDDELTHKYAGSLFGLGTDVKIGNRSSIMIRLDMGKLDYNYTVYDYGIYSWGLPISRYTTSRIGCAVDYRFNIISKMQSFGLLYLSGGFLTNVHFNEKAYELFDITEYKADKPRIFNILTTLKLGYERDITKKISLNLDYYLGIRIWHNSEDFEELKICPVSNMIAVTGFKIGIKYTW